MEYQAVYIITHSLIFLIGVPGNLLVLCVYWSKPVRTSTVILINALAALDLATCIFSTFYLYWVFFSFQSPILYQVYFCCLDILVCTTLFVTTVIAFDRFEAISRPHRRFLTAARARMFTFACPGVVLIIVVPAYIINVLPNRSDLECKFLGILLYNISCTLGVMCYVIIVCLYTKIYMTIRKRGRVSNSKGPDDGYCPSQNAMQVRGSKGRHQITKLPHSVRQEYLNAEWPKGTQIGHLPPPCTVHTRHNEELSVTTNKQQHKIVISVLPYQVDSLESVVKSAPNRNPLNEDSIHTKKSPLHSQRVQFQQVSKSCRSAKQAATSISSQDGRGFRHPEPDPLWSQQSESCSSLKESKGESHNLANPGEGIGDRKVVSCSSLKPSQSKGKSHNLANPEGISDRKFKTSVTRKESEELGSLVALRSVSASTSPRMGGPQPDDTDKHITTSLKPGTTFAEPIRSHQRQHHQRATGVKFKTTAMLIAATAVFFATWIPFTSFAIRGQVVYCTQVEDPHEDLFGVLPNIILINSIANPFIYSIANANFRKASARVLRKIKVAYCCCTS